MYRLVAAVAVFLSFAAAAIAQKATIATLAGTGDKGYSGDGTAANKAKLNQPFDAALDHEQKYVYFSDTFNHCIRRVELKSGTIETVAGSGKKGYSGDGGKATNATLNEPYGVELDKDGNLYLVDRLNYCIRRVDTKGIITTVAGTGKSGGGGQDGVATQIAFKEPNGLCLDGKGNLYVADVADQRVRAIDLGTGMMKTLCGTGRKENKGDGGPYAEASLFGPRAVAMAKDGSLLICEREGNGLRKVDFATGKITRFAGTGKKGFTGDGGPALEATFNGPKELDVDRDGNVFIVDTENHAIRRIDWKTGNISTVAGTGKAGGSGDGGDAIKGSLARPHGVAVGADGRIYIGDTENNKIRMVK